MQLVGSGYGSRADSITHCLINGLLHLTVLILPVVHELLCVLHDGSHHLQCLHRVLAVGGLAGQHHSIGAVVYCIRNVGHLGTGRTGIPDHGIQHLGSGDDQLALVVALPDDFLLKLRQHLGLNLNAQIASGHHDAVGLLDDLVQIVKTLLGLNLCDDLHVRAGILNDLANLTNGIGVPYEGGCHEIIAHLDTELDVLDILVGQGRKADGYVGHIHALALAQLAAVHDSTVNLGAVNLIYGQSDETVIDENGVARLHILVQSGIVDVHALCIAHTLLCCEGDVHALCQRHLLVVLQDAGTNLRSLGIQQGCDGTSAFLAGLLQKRQSLQVLVVVTVRKIKTCHIHILSQLQQNLVIILIGSQGTNNLCFSHRISSSHVNLRRSAAGFPQISAADGSIRQASA